MLIRKNVRAPGEYQVRVTVAARPALPDTVRLQIGSVRRSATISRGHPNTSVSVTLDVPGRVLMIRATHRYGPLALGVSLAPARAPHGTTNAGSGEAGVLGTTGPTGPTGPAASPVVPVASGPTSAAGATAPTGPSGATGPTGAPGPPGAPSSWHLVFDDEFNSLNTAVWSTSRYDDGTIDPGFNSVEEECFDPAEVTVAGGEADLNLVAKQERCGGLTEPYAGAILTSNGKFSYTYGYIEARIWMPGSAGAFADWPAFWASGQNWPVGGEIDVVEGLGGPECWHFHDPLGAPGGCAAGDYTGGWHTFGADWEPGVVTYYYDGLAVGSVTSGVTSSPMSLYLDLAIQAGDPIQAPATMRVDYVRLWQH